MDNDEIQDMAERIATGARESKATTKYLTIPIAGPANRQEISLIRDEVRRLMPGKSVTSCCDSGLCNQEFIAFTVEL